MADRSPQIQITKDQLVEFLNSFLKVLAKFKISFASQKASQQTHLSKLIQDHDSRRMLEIMLKDKYSAESMLNQMNDDRNKHVLQVVITAWTNICFHSNEYLLPYFNEESINTQANNRFYELNPHFLPAFKLCNKVIDSQKMDEFSPDIMLDILACMYDLYQINPIIDLSKQADFLVKGRNYKKMKEAILLMISTHPLKYFNEDILLDVLFWKFTKSEGYDDFCYFNIELFQDKTPLLVTQVNEYLKVIKQKNNTSFSFNI